LKEGLGALAVSYETICRWVNAIKSDREERDDAPCSGAQTSATDECHVEQVKSFLVRMRSICWRSLNVCSKYLPYPHQQLGETEVCAEWIPHVLIRVLLVTICPQCWRNENNGVFDRILMVDE